jgi:hypothetical protein
MGRKMAVKSPRIVTYTCVTGGYDEIKQPKSVEESIQYVCFTDRPPKEPGAWCIRPIPCNYGNDAVNNRFVKMHPHMLFPDHEYSVYIDGSIEICGDLSPLIHDAMSAGVIAAYQHTFRNCSYSEAEECAALGYDWPWRIRSQMARYRNQGFPESAGLFEANVLIRSHHDERVKNLMQDWWLEYRGGVKRDQLSLVFLAWKHGLQIHNLGASDPRVTQRHFRIQLSHKRPKALVTIMRRQAYKLFQQAK